MSSLSATLFSQARKYLSPVQDELTADVETVLDRLQSDHISDYSFIVAPISKAYEGYLKDLFLKLHIINQDDYESDRFRVGKTLNPSLRYKRFSIYQKLADFDEAGEELAEILWDAWKFGRNEIFHYFPNQLKKITLDDAENRITLLLNAIIKSGGFYEQHRRQNDLL